MEPQNKRNFILLGHAQSGKTTLAESMLYFAKATTRKGSVADGTTVSDYSFDEIERKSSINSSLLFCDYKNHRIQIIDAPGYADFFGEIISGLRAVDGAILVVDAVSGVEVGTERAWQLLEENGLPCLIFINKTDKDGADVNKVIADIKAVLSKNAVVFNSLQAPDVVEAVAESDDLLLEKYLEGAKLTDEEVEKGFHVAVDNRKVFPIISGSSLMDKGIGDLLDDIIKFLPSPLERPKVLGRDPANPDNLKEVGCSGDGHLSAFVFKNISDPYVGSLPLCVYSRAHCTPIPILIM